MLCVGLLLVVIGGVTNHEDKENPVSQFLLIILIIKLTANLAESNNVEDEDVDSSTMTVRILKSKYIYLTSSCQASSPAKEGCSWCLLSRSQISS